MTNIYHFFLAAGMCWPRPSPPHLHFEFPLLSPALLQIPIHVSRSAYVSAFYCPYTLVPDPRNFTNSSDVLGWKGYPPTDDGGLKGFLPQLDEFYFTTDEKKLLENCRCIVPNFMND
jgi:hypothetical protein